MLPKTKAFLMESCGSTMDAAKHLSYKTHLQKSSFFVATQRQTQGRGRLGRTWQQPDPPGSNAHYNSAEYQTAIPANKEQNREFQSFAEIYKNEKEFLPFTFALASDELRIPLEWVSLLASVAAYDAFLTLYNFLLKNAASIKYIPKNQWNLCLKWPNDLIWIQNNTIEKIAGILCEAHMQSKSKENDQNTSASKYSGISHIFIGVGINFFQHPNLPNTNSFFNKITYKFNKNSLNNLTRSQILQKFSRLIEFNLKKYLCKKFTLDQIKSFVLKRSLPIGTLLSIDNKKIQGKFFGLNEHGALLLDVSHQMRTIYSTDSIHIESNFKNILCIDFGNTFIHITAQNAKFESIHTKISYKALNTKNVYKQIKKNFTPTLNKPIEIFYVSVNSIKITKESLNKIKRNFQQLLKHKINKIHKITEKEIFNHFQIPKTFDYDTLGADRALKCIFAYEYSQQFKKNILIFSFGTATTCEGFSKEGKMIENFVFPGIQMSFDALHHFTALLPKLKAYRIQFVKNPEYWTQKLYVKRGIILSTAATILTTAKMHEPCDIILTGGNAQEIKYVLMQIEKNECQQLNNIKVMPNIETQTLAKLY